MRAFRFGWSFEDLATLSGYCRSSEPSNLGKRLRIPTFSKEFKAIHE